MLDSVDEIIIGGGMCFTFLAASGIPVGDSLVEKEMLETCRRLMDSGISIKLPLDFTAMNSNGQIGQLLMEEFWVDRQLTHVLDVMLQKHHLHTHQKPLHLLQKLNNQ